MTPKTTTTAPENPSPQEEEDTGYHSIRYHCPACNFAFDIGGFLPADKLPQEPILLCPKCQGPALRVTAEQSRMLQEFSEVWDQAGKLAADRMKEAGLLKTDKNGKTVPNWNHPWMKSSAGTAGNPHAD